MGYLFAKSCASPIAEPAKSGRRVRRYVHDRSGFRHAAIVGVSTRQHLNELLCRSHDLHRRNLPDRGTTQPTLRSWERGDRRRLNRPPVWARRPHCPDRSRRHAIQSGATISVSSRRSGSTTPGMARPSSIAEGCWAGRPRYGVGAASRLIRRISCQRTTEPDGQLISPSLAHMSPMHLNSSMLVRPSFPRPSRCRTIPFRSTSLSAISSLTASSDTASRRTYGGNGVRNSRDRADVMSFMGRRAQASSPTRRARKLPRSNSGWLRTGSIRVVAATIVLACGGLETPRLLLASRRSRSCGLGNEHDLVGRFYMTHLVSNANNAGALRFAAQRPPAHSTSTRHWMGLWASDDPVVAEARRRESIPNIAFRPNRPPMDDASHRDPVLSAMFLLRSLLIPPEYARSLATKLGGALPSGAWRDHSCNIIFDIPALFDSAFIG